ncbi:MAG: cation:proton antiporter [Solirubrobacteraceae bacterium]
MLLIRFVFLAEQVGLETILGLFSAGALLALIGRDEAMTHPQLRLKLEAAGFGMFIAVFLITTGIQFDRSARFSSGSTLARVPLFLIALLAVRGLPALLSSHQIGRLHAAIAGLLKAVSLPFIVTATMIGGADRSHLQADRRCDDRRRPAVGDRVSGPRALAAATRRPDERDTGQWHPQRCLCDPER